MKSKGILSAEDMADVRKTETLFKTNLMGLQTLELLNSVKISSTKLTSIHKTLKKLAKTVTQLQPSSLSAEQIDANLAGDRLSSFISEFDLPIPSSITFPKLSPSNVSICKTVSSKPQPIFFIQIDLPSSFTTSRPFSKATWLVRRHLFLTHLQNHLSSYNTSFTPIPGATPGVYDLLLSLSEGSLNYSVILKPALPPSLFSLHTHLLSSPCPILYNSIVASLHIPLIEDSLLFDELQDALVLLIVWLRKQEFLVQLLLVLMLCLQLK
ncbi:hypothetical protein GEMRC1_003170 [Eukaryota sp. GEM-RC1]